VKPVNAHLKTFTHMHHRLRGLFAHIGAPPGCRLTRGRVLQLTVGVELQRHPRRDAARATAATAATAITREPGLIEHQVHQARVLLASSRTTTLAIAVRQILLQVTLMTQQLLVRHAATHAARHTLLQHAEAVRLPHRQQGIGARKQRVAVGHGANRAVFCRLLLRVLALLT
jgi:hypothetical protein